MVDIRALKNILATFNGQNQLDISSVAQNIKTIKLELMEKDVYNIQIAQTLDNLTL